MKSFSIELSIGEVIELVRLRYCLPKSMRCFFDGDVKDTIKFEFKQKKKEVLKDDE